MRVRIIGAGPAGLYLAILLKKADRTHDVAVIERNAPDATFGWGVVFSEETLGALRDADPESHLQITDTFARWPAIDIHHRGRLLRSRGHAFSAIPRKLLLHILQLRARELGAELRFDTEVTDVAEPDADLVVGADGVNSLVRRTYAADFGERVAPQGCKYVWFGTDLVLDAFTFIFKATEAGLVQVHAYPFDEHTSTWIVECPEHTWRAAGLRRDGRGRVAAGLRGAVRRGAAGPPSHEQPLAVDELPARSQRELAPRQCRAARRRRPHRALLDRLGYEARDGGRDRAVAGVPAPPARPRARAGGL